MPQNQLNCNNIQKVNRYIKLQQTADRKNINNTTQLIIINFKKLKKKKNNQHQRRSSLKIKTICYTSRWQEYQQENYMLKEMKQQIGKSK